MSKVLIISPYFAPSNAADMQRIRMSLPYFKDFGWEAELVTVFAKHSEMVKDNLLSESVPPETIIHYVKAYSKRWTSKFGLGSLALRSLWFYKQSVNKLLMNKKYDLIYFSTTQYPVCILGAYWKKRFGIPYVIDMQDPWHSDYYRNKPKAQRPPKYWFSYRLNKWLEPIAMKHVSGLISVSQAYIEDLKKRYPLIKGIPSETITFGAFEKDFEITAKYAAKIKTPFEQEVGKIQVVYVGRGGQDMLQAVRPLFMAMQKGLSLQHELFERFNFLFIGTSYAASGSGLQSIQPLADGLGLQDYVFEQTDRIGFYESLASLQKADILFIPGSDDPKYTASKLYPYLMSQKTILAVFHEKSSAVDILRSCSPDGKLFTFTLFGFTGDQEELISNIYRQLSDWATGPIKPSAVNREVFAEYSASAMTAKQTRLFDRVISCRTIDG